MSSVRQLVLAHFTTEKDPVTKLEVRKKCKHCSTSYKPSTGSSTLKYHLTTHPAVSLVSAQKHAAMRR